MKKLTFLFIAASLFISNAATVSACSCVPPSPPKESLQESSAVFSGRVIKKDPPFFQMASIDPTKVTFNVFQVWKGTEGKILTLTTPNSSASCGYEFEENKDYIVYARQEEGKLTTSLCSRTQPLTFAQLDLQELGEGTTPENIDTEAESTNLAPKLALAAGAVLILGALGFAFWKRKKN